MVHGVAATKVVKKLGPQQGGALGWARRYGAALICVRYRLAEDGMRRYTTVELLVDEAPTAAARSHAIVGVRIAFDEAELRDRVKSAGGRWDGARKLWRLPLAQAKALQLADRVVLD